MKNSYALNLGLVLAAVSIIVFLLGAVVDGGMIFGISMFVLTLAVIVALVARTLKKQRADQGGLLTFGDGFKTAFIGLAISGIIAISFTYVYANFIDSGYVDRTVVKTIETSMKFMEGNMPEGQMESALETIETDTRAGFTLAGMAKGFGFYLIFYAILALIFAGTMKKNPEA